MELEPEVKILDRKLDCSLTPPSEHTRAINEHTLSLHLRGVSEAHKAGMITLFAPGLALPLAGTGIRRAHQAAFV